MTTQQMMKAPLKPGYWFVNVAPLGESPDWKAQTETPQETRYLFGYEPKDLLAKQYKVTHA